MEKDATKKLFKYIRTEMIAKAELTTVKLLTCVVTEMIKQTGLKIFEKQNMHSPGTETNNAPGRETIRKFSYRQTKIIKNSYFIKETFMEISTQENRVSLVSVKDQYDVVIQ